MIMQQKKWKPPYWLYIILAFMALYLSLAIAYVYSEGDNILVIFQKLSSLFSEKNYIFNLKAAIKNIKTFGTAFFMLEFCVFFYVLYDVTKQRNFMPGKEFSTSDWGDIEKINRKFAEYADKKKTEFTKGNRIYSEKLRIGMDGDVTRINNHAIVVGGSGTGKSLFLLTPNIYQANTESKFPGSYVFTDPKGELLLKNGKYFESIGYKVKVLNLIPGYLSESDRFNPFLYVKNESDVLSLINNILDNTTPPDTHPNDPLWENAERLFYYSLFLLVWMEHERFGWDMTFETFLNLLTKVEATGYTRGDGEDKKSELDEIFDELVYSTLGQPNGGMNHPAYHAYHEVMSGAEDTVRSIIISIHARFTIFKTPEVRRLFSGDDLDLTSIGTGISGDEKNVRTALFIKIPDSDTTYNAIAGMAYTLMFQQLYYKADYEYGGKLPVPVTFWMDEFANIVLPKNFPKLLATMRSRLMSCVIFIQNTTQLKIIYKEGWENIIGNCDVFVYLGGNEPSTFEFISKNLGKKTIYKRSRGETKGRNGSSSLNDDSLGRELALPEEVRELDNDYCVVLVRGRKPILDHKFRTLQSPEFEKSKKLGVYLADAEKTRDREIVISEISEEAAMKFADEIISINLDKEDYSMALKELDEIIIQNEEEEKAEKEAEREIDIEDMSLEMLLSHPDFLLSADELIEVTEGIKDGLTEEEIKTYILLGNAERMKEKRLLINSLHLLKQNQQTG